MRSCHHREAEGIAVQRQSGKWKVLTIQGTRGKNCSTRLRAKLTSSLRQTIFSHTSSPCLPFQSIPQQRTPSPICQRVWMPLQIDPTSRLDSCFAGDFAGCRKRGNNQEIANANHAQLEKTTGQMEERAKKSGGSSVALERPSKHRLVERRKISNCLKTSWKARN
jgi:hypothetical protein